MKRNLKLFFGVFLLGLFTISCSSPVESITKNVNAAIEEGDYAKAYTYVEPYYRDPDLMYTCYQLNEKILRHEIASLVESDNNGSNAAMIIFAISEKAKYNDYMSRLYKKYEDEQKKEMTSYAIKLAQSVGNEVLAEQLTKEYTEDEETTYDDDDE